MSSQIDLTSDSESDCEIDNVLFDAHFCANNSCTIKFRQGEKQFHCRICGQHEKTVEMFMAHRYQSHSDILHECYICNAAYPTIQLLAIHLVNDHQYSTIHPYACKKCGIAFKTCVCYLTHLTTRRCCYQP